MTIIAVMTDSGADLTPELIEKYSIKVVPFSVVLPDTDEILKERIDITNEEYYERVITAKKHPHTSQPNPSEMVTIFKDLEKEGYEEILYITMAASITGTYSTAHLARKIYEKDGGKAKIEIFDSFQASMAIGIQAIKAVLLFEQGLSMKEVIKELEYFKMNELKSTLTVESLKYLMKGGRVSKWRYAVGSLLGLVPCLEGTYHGTLEAFGAARSYEDAIKKIVDYAFEEIKNKENLAIYVVGGKAEKGINLAKEYLKMDYPEIKILDTFPIGAAIFTHTGPGIVALILFKYFDH